VQQSGLMKTAFLLYFFNFWSRIYFSPIRPTPSLLALHCNGFPKNLHPTVIPSDEETF
jgi:hypothetical protein